MLMPPKPYGIGSGDWMQEVTLKMRAEIEQIALEMNWAAVPELHWQGANVYVTRPDGRKVDCTKYAEKVLPRKRRFFQ